MTFMEAMQNVLGSSFRSDKPLWLDLVKIYEHYDILLKQELSTKEPLNLEEVLLRIARLDRSVIANLTIHDNIAAVFQASFPSQNVLEVLYSRELGRMIVEAVKPHITEPDVNLNYATGGFSTTRNIGVLVSAKTNRPIVAHVSFLFPPQEITTLEQFCQNLREMSQGFKARGVHYNPDVFHFYNLSKCL